MQSTSRIPPSIMAVFCLIFNRLLKNLFLNMLLLVLIMLSLSYLVKNSLHNNQINARALIGQPAVDYCTGKPPEKSRVF